MKYTAKNRNKTEVVW